MVGENGETRIFNFRCHLCRNIGLKVFQLEPEATFMNAIEIPDPQPKAQSKKIIVPKQGVNTKNKTLTALKHANLLLRRQ